MSRAAHAHPEVQKPACHYQPPRQRDICLTNMKKSLRDRLYDYLLRSHGFIASGDLQRVVSESTSYSPQNVGRRLRELTEDGLLEVQYRKGHAWYRAISTLNICKTAVSASPTSSVTSLLLFFRSDGQHPPGPRQ